MDDRIRPGQVTRIEDPEIGVPVHLVGELRGLSHEQADEVPGGGEQGGDLSPDQSAAAGDEDPLPLLPRHQGRIRALEEVDVHEHAPMPGFEGGFEVAAEAAVDDVEALRRHRVFDVVVDLRASRNGAELMRVLPLAQRTLLEFIDEGEPRRALGMHGGEGAPEQTIGAGHAGSDLRDRARGDRRVALLDDLLRPMG